MSMCDHQLIDVTAAISTKNNSKAATFKMFWTTLHLDRLEPKEYLLCSHHQQVVSMIGVHSTVNVSFEKIMMTLDWAVAVEVMKIQYCALSRIVNVFDLILSQRFLSFFLLTSETFSLVF